MSAPASQAIPIVMTLAGHDPTSGAGIIADSEAISSQGCYPVSVITCLTVQDTHNVQHIEPLADYLIEQQAETLFADMTIAAIKIGLLGSIGVIEAVRRILLQAPDVPVVLDPILAAGGGKDLAPRSLIEAIRQYLLPLTTLLTPNLPEAARLALQGNHADEHAMSLLEQGCQHVLLTGTHATTERVENTLYGESKRLRTWTWERLADTYHGSGCTLAAACAANLAKGMEISKAVAAAQAYTWGSLQAGRKLGGGQWLPNRLYWVQN
ncbi:MAG: hydroxymethylpyrimidine/phosphomethylpyrimidine kinase [Thiothrix sp.]